MEKEKLRNALIEAEFTISHILEAISFGAKGKWEESNDEATNVECCLETFERNFGLKFPETTESVKRMIWSTDIERRDPLYQSCTVALLDFIGELQENLKNENIKILNESLDRMVYLAHAICNAIEAGYKKNFVWCSNEIRNAEKYLSDIEVILGKEIGNARRDLNSVKLYIERKRPSKICENCIGVMIWTFRAIREAIQ
jgi:hypothetical protein